MRRLIVKELLETRWYAAGTLAALWMILLLGNPLFYRWSLDSTGWVLLPACGALLMGLSGYARETSNGTLDFVLSRPVRWWWLALSKALGGLLSLAIVALATLPVYLLRVPALYRPFLQGGDLRTGLLTCWLMLGGAFLLGLLASSVVPGTVLAATVALGAAVVWGWTMDTVTTRVSNAPVMLYVSLLVLLVAGVLAVRTPIVLAPRRRMGMWGKSFVLSVAILPAFAYGMRGAGIEVEPLRAVNAIPSWDRQVWALAPFYGQSHYLWIRPPGKPARVVDRTSEIMALGWSEDSSTFYYIAGWGSGAAMKSVSAATGWRPTGVATVATWVRGEIYAPGWGADVATSPSRRFIAFRSSVDQRSKLCLVDAARHTARTVVSLKTITGFYWRGDRDLILLTKDGQARAVPVP